LILFIFRFTFFCGKGRDDVFHLSDIFERQIPHEPIVDDKDHMFFVFDLVDNFVPLCEGVTHDSDKHVHHVDHDNEAGQPEDNLEQWFHRLFSYIKTTCIGLANQ